MFMEDFESAKQLSSYFGIAPRLYESGTSIKCKSKICKMGMGLVRKLLYLCALSAVKCNKKCKDLYERLLEKGKSKKKGLTAVANKLLRQAFSIVKNKTVFIKINLFFIIEFRMTIFKTFGRPPLFYIRNLYFVCDLFLFS